VEGKEDIGAPGQIEVGREKGHHLATGVGALIRVGIDEISVDQLIEQDTVDDRGHDLEAQVGVINEHRLLVSLKTDPDPGTVDVVALDRGAVIGVAPTVVSAPAGTLTPFGFSVYPDGTALITLAHSSQDGLFRDGAFTAVIAAGQAAPCWMTRVGKYVFSANTGSKTISRLVVTGNNIFVDGLVAANIPGGSPGDIDAAGGTLGVIDHGAGQSHLTLFTYNEFGELSSTGSAINLGVPNANGVAIVPPARDND
jgi:hypothetical protein